MDGAWQGAAPWGDEAREGEGALSWCSPRRRRNLSGLGERRKPCLKQYKGPDEFANVILSWENIIAGQE